jgi:hypothetical protein
MISKSTWSPKVGPKSSWIVLKASIRLDVAKLLSKRILISQRKMAILR